MKWFPQTIDKKVRKFVYCWCESIMHSKYKNIRHFYTENCWCIRKLSNRNWGVASSVFVLIEHLIQVTLLFCLEIAVYLLSSLSLAIRLSILCIPLGPIKRIPSRQFSFNIFYSLQLLTWSRRALVGSVLAY